MKDPEWLAIPAWIGFFIISFVQNWLRRHQTKFGRNTQIFAIYCAAAAIFGYGSAGLPKNGQVLALKSLAIAAILFTAAGLLRFNMAGRMKRPSR